MALGCSFASTDSDLPPVLKGPPENLARYIAGKDSWYRASYGTVTTQLADVIKGSTSELDVLIRQFFNSSAKRGDPMPVVLMSPDGSSAMLVVDHGQGALELFPLELSAGHWTALPMVRIEKK
jgi:hypothetical protein